jgi:hypothetical protein
MAIKPIADTVVGADGRSYGAFGVGQSVLSIPLYLVGRLVERLASPDLRAYFSGVDLGDWGGTVPIFFVSLFCQFITPLVGVLVYSFGLRLGFSRRRAAAVALMYGLGTAAWVYAREYFQHPLETCLLLLAVTVLFAHRDDLRPGHALAAGLALGLGIFVRVNLALIVPALAVYLLYLTRRPGRSLAPRGRRGATSIGVTGIGATPTRGYATKMGWKPALLNLLSLLAPVGVGLALVYTVNYIRFGSAPAGPGGSLGLSLNGIQAEIGWRLARVGWSNPLWLGLVANLFSPGRSLFLYSPPAVLALLGLGRFYRRWPAEAVLFVAIFLLYLLPYSVYGHWHGGWAWGPRLLLPTLPFLLLVAGHFADSRRRWGVAALLTVLGMGVQLLGVAINYSYVHWDWLRMGLSLENPNYLFWPQISPLPMHLQALLQGRYIDLWLVWVYQRYGGPVAVVSALIPLMALGCGLALLKPLAVAPHDPPGLG